MKKIYSYVLALVITLLSVTAMVFPAAADDGGSVYMPNPDDVVFYEENGFRYFLLPDGTASVTAFPNNDTHIVIPDTLGGHTVTEIVGYPYTDFVPSETTSITLPSSIRALSNDIFFLLTD